ncbi:MAG: FG-GAP-like repeat-containing protein, partial [Saprospiraceae bacterium]|nr:FG-GAP-like repeat-containing protein [Saprospiraceae bacterium]
DNDGDQEIFTTDMLPGTNSRIKTMTNFEPYYVNDVKYQSNYGFQYVQNCLQVNLGDAVFSEEAYISGVAATDWSWGALMFDFNLDGLRDIFVSNGILNDITDHDFKDFVSSEQNILDIIANADDPQQKGVLEYLPSQPVPNAAFMNNGALEFSNQSKAMGLADPSFSNGSAYGDLDNDGDLDLVVNNVNMPCFIYENQAVQQGNHFLKVEFRGSELNPLGIGATMQIWAASGMQQMELYPARGFQSSMEPKLLFGLGQNQIVDSMLVVWPGGLSRKYGSIKVDTMVTIAQVDAVDPYQTPEIRQAHLFESVSGLTSNEVRHVENDFNDFQHEVLLPHKLSNEGPKILTGDINKDQLDDFIILGAADDPDKVYIQTNSGTFVRTSQPQLDLDFSSESNCGALFDADNDNDLDLMIGVGGNEYQKGFASFAIRFYRNDGKGNFSKDVMGAPQVGGNLSCIKPYDFDRDGDLDLFLGGRVVPGNYGLMPRSFLLLNEGGAIWRDVTKELTGNLGMVTDAVWTDLNGDHFPELLAVGEWMPITVIHNDRGELVSRSTIPNSNGWWNCIEKADLDGDGDSDFVIGNWGKNSKWQVGLERPLRMYVKDFDSNQKSEFVIDWFAPEESKPYPFATKMDLTSQLPHLRKVALKYETYAGLTYDQLFSEEERAGAQELVVNTLATSVLWQQDSVMELRELPRSAQLAPVYATMIDDLDSDGSLDIVLMGNQYGLKPEIGRQDGYGSILLGQEGVQKFNSCDPHSIGLKIKGEVRDLEIVEVLGEMIFVIGRNNNQVLFYSLRRSDDS